MTESLPPHIELACKNDFSYFCKYVLNQKVGACHKEIIKELEKKEKHLLVMMARGHFKTWMISRAFTLWKIWSTPEKEHLEIGLETSNMTQTQFILAELISAEIKKNPILSKVLLPDNMFHATWSSKMIVTKNGHRVVAMPFGRKGFHFDYLISDDLQQESETSSASVSIDAIKRTFWNSSWPMTQSRRGFHIVIGTPISLDDLYAEFVGDDTPDWKCLKFPAVITDKDGKWLRPSFPEHFDLEQLEVIKRNSPIWAWQSEYMLQPLGAGTSLFPPELIKHAMNMPKPTIEVPEYYIPTDEEKEDIHTIDKSKFIQYYGGWDVALSQKEGSDFAAFVVIGKAPNVPLWIETFWNLKITDEEQLQKVRDLHQTFRFSKVVVERTGIGYALAQKATRDPGLATFVEPFDTTHSSKSRIVGNLELLMQNKNLCLNGFKKIAEELATFGIKTKGGKQTFEALAGHDDIVIALCLAVHASGGYLPHSTPSAMMY